MVLPGARLTGLLEIERGFVPSAFAAAPLAPVSGPSAMPAPSPLSVSEALPGLKMAVRCLDLRVLDERVSLRTATFASGFEPPELTPEVVLLLSGVEATGLDAVEAVDAWFVESFASDFVEVGLLLPEIGFDVVFSAGVFETDFVCAARCFAEAGAPLLRGVESSLESSESESLCEERNDQHSNKQLGSPKSVSPYLDDVPSASSS